MAQAIAPSPPAAPTGWMVAAPQDLLLVIATPLLIVPLAALLTGDVGVEKFALYVAAFGALGHHLPGMLRAYGDRDLFERFRVRFIVAPIVLASVCIFFSIRDLGALVVMALLWGVWHGLAQVYGFGRIYEAKLGVRSPFTSRVDFAMCIAWFGAGMFYSPERMGDLLQKLYDCGVPLIAPAALQNFLSAWGLATGIVTFVFLVNLIGTWRRGVPLVLPKLLLMASSFGFWWYAMVGIHNAILGIAIFEIFHDVQYLTIVWVFNRRVVEKGGRVGAFTRYLFRRSPAMIALYVGLVLAYGLLALINENSGDAGSFHHILAGIIVASGFLHFYYDGFIWKVRDRSTRSGLDVATSAADRIAESTTRARGWQSHVAGWAVFAVPVALLATSQTLDPPGAKIAGYLNIAEAVPDDDRTRLKLASSLRHRERFDEAKTHLDHAIRVRPHNPIAYKALGGLHMQRAEWAEAVAAFDEALAQAPHDTDARMQRGSALLSSGDADGALAEFSRILNDAPYSLEALTRLGNAEHARGNPSRARKAYEHVLRSDANQGGAHFGLAILFESEGRLEEAVVHFRTAARLDRRFKSGRNEAARIEASIGD